MVQKVVSSNPGFGQLKTGKLSQSKNKWVSFSIQGRIRQRKEKDGTRLSYAVLKI